MRKLTNTSMRNIHEKTENIYDRIDKQLEGFYHCRKSFIKTFPCKKQLLSDCSQQT